jgi:hypothetical protein
MRLGFPDIDHRLKNGIYFTVIDVERVELGFF